MADVVDQNTRSRMMSGIRGKDTKPEVVLRGKLREAGLDYRLHGANLPGKPDLVLGSRRTVIFVHGCFWHRHEGCHWCSTPSSNADFWAAKFQRNATRDAEVIGALHSSGWRVAVVWECGLRAPNIEDTTSRLLTWLQTNSDFFESELVRPRDSTR
ncbi:MAG: DNA mismatch endonuclease Vsr [Sphingomicrobium sp.]